MEYVILFVLLFFLLFFFFASAEPMGEFVVGGKYVP